MATGLSIAPLLAGAAVGGIAIGLYEMWRASRRPAAFGPNEVLFGVVLGLALAAPLAASHLVAAAASGWLIDEETRLARFLAFALLSTTIYLFVINRLDRTLRLAGPGATLHHVSDKLMLLGVSLVATLALSMGVR